MNKIFIIFSALISLLIFSTAPTAFAVLEQPPGQLPITEPLRPIEPGMKPNYAANAEADQNVKPNVSETNPADNNNTPTDTTATPPGNDSTDQSANQTTPEVTANPQAASGNKKWYILGLVLIILIIAAVTIWRKKISKVPGALLVAGLLVLTSFLMPHFSKAQSLPKNGPPIQRTIEEVDSNGATPDSNSGAAVINPISEENTRAGKTVIFGLGAIVLIIVAAGAAGIFWSRGGGFTEDSAPELPVIPVNPPKTPNPKRISKTPQKRPASRK